MTVVWIVAGWLVVSALTAWFLTRGARVLKRK